MEPINRFQCFPKQVPFSSPYSVPCIIACNTLHACTFFWKENPSAFHGLLRWMKVLVCLEFFNSLIGLKFIYYGVYLFIFKNYLFFLALLGLHCCAQAFSSCSKWELLSHGSAWASDFGRFSCFRAWALGCLGFSSCGTWVWLPCRMWNLTGTRIRLVSPALAGGFLATGPPGKSEFTLLKCTL